MGSCEPHRANSSVSKPHTCSVIVSEPHLSHTCNADVSLKALA